MSDEIIVRDSNGTQFVQCLGPYCQGGNLTTQCANHRYGVVCGTCEVNNPSWLLDCTANRSLQPGYTEWSGQCIGNVAFLSLTA